jgi:hypothetical protein
MRVMPLINYKAQIQDQFAVFLELHKVNQGVSFSLKKVLSFYFESIRIRIGPEELMLVTFKLSM